MDKPTLFQERLRQARIERIAVIKPSALGDVVQTLPLLECLKSVFPGSHISWVINRELKSLLAAHPDIDDLLVFDRRGSWRNSMELWQGLRRGRFDLVLDLQGLLRTALMTWATQAPFRIGLETAREGSAAACHLLIPDTGREVPAHERYWRVATWLSPLSPQPISHTAPRIPVPVDFEDLNWAQTQLVNLPRPLLAIHAGAKWVTKRWPAAKFGLVARMFLARTGGTLLLVGGPDDAPLAAEMIEHLDDTPRPPRYLNLAGRTSLPRLAAVLAQSDLLLSNDSGPLHLAAAQGTPVVGLYTCTSEKLSGPAGTGHRLLSAPVPCAASYRKQCSHTGDLHHCCFDSILVEQVWAAVAAQFSLSPAAAARSA